MHLKIVNSKTDKKMSLEEALNIMENEMTHHLHCAYGDDVNWEPHNICKEAWDLVRKEIKKNIK